MKQIINKGSIMITGTSTGIGKACALYLNKLGFRVFACVRKKKDANTLKKLSSGLLYPVILDITDDKSINNSYNQINKITEKKGLYGLINNAGIAVSCPIEFLPVSQLREQIEVNLIGQIKIIQKFLPLIRKGNGRIINIGSISGKMATPFFGAYAASKFAMEAITDTLRMELMKWNIPVSIIEPGRIKTPIWEKLLTREDNIIKKFPSQAHTLYGEMINNIHKSRKQKNKSNCTPDVAAKTVSHILFTKSPKARYTIGWDAKIWSIAIKLLPSRISDRLIMKVLKLK